MSPAMVDFRSPASASASPKLQSNRHRSQNSGKGRFPSSPSRALFNQSGIPDPFPSMNRMDLGHGVPVPRSAPFPPPPFSSFSAAEKPMPAPGLSRPHLVKVRRKSATSQVRPAAAAQDDGAGLGFNPSRSEVPGAASHDGAEDSTTRLVREQLYGWKTFVPESLSRSASGPEFVFGVGSSSNSCSSNTEPGSTQGTASSFGENSSGNSGTGFFVFGGGVDKISSSNLSSSQNWSAQSLGSAESGKYEGPELIFGAGSLSASNVRSGDTGVAMGGWISSDSFDSVFSDTGLFVFGSNVNNNSNLRQNSSLRSDDDLSFQLNLEKPTNEDFDKLDSGVFSFKGGEKKSSHSSKNSFDSYEGLFAAQPVRTKKLDQMNSSNEGSQKEDMGAYVFGSLEETKTDFDQNSLLRSHENLFSKLPEDSRKLKIENPGKDEYVSTDPGIFVFGSKCEKRSNATKSSTFDSFDCSFSKLPEETRKLNLQTLPSDGSRDTGSSFFVSRSGVKKDARLSETSSLGLDDRVFSKLPGELRKLNLQTSHNEKDGNDKHGAFVFGSDFRKATSSGMPSTYYDESTLSELPGAVGKMKLNSSGNEDNFEKTKQGDYRGNHDNFSAFHFTGNKDTANLFVASGTHKLHKEIERLKISSCTTLPNSTNCFSDSLSGEPVFEGNANSCFSSCQTSTVKSSVLQTTKLQEEMRKLSAEGSADDACLEDIKKTAFEQKSDGVFFGSSDSSYDPLRHKSVNMPSSHTKIQNSAMRGDRASPSDTLATSDSSTFKFNVNSGNEDNGSTINATTPPLVHDSGKPSTQATISACSPVRDFLSSGVDFTTTCMHSGFESPVMEFKSQKKETTWLTKENLFTEPHQSKPYGMKKGDSKGVRLKKKRGKLRQTVPIHPSIDKQFVTLNKGTEGNMEQNTTDEYSPMDCSPYQEILVPGECSRETSVESDDSIHFDSRDISTDAQRSVSADKEEELISAVEHFKNRGEPPSGLGKESVVAENENVGLDVKMRTAFETEPFSFGSSIKQPCVKNGSGFTFTSGVDDFSESNFLFSATSSGQGPSSAPKRSYRRKSRVKGGQDLHPDAMPLSSTSSNLFLFPNAPMPASPSQEHKGSDDDKIVGKVKEVEASPSQEHKGSDDDKMVGKVKEVEANQEFTATATSRVSAHEACEKWRLRGNEAYADGNLSKAEDYYSRGVNCLSLKKTDNYSKSLVLCYSNRAATRMSLGRLREALTDCKMAIAMDPRFLRAQVRAGNIHLSLGEPGHAIQHFNMCLQLEHKANSDEKILLEAADGLERAKKLNSFIENSLLILMKRTYGDATKALEIISEALSISPYSESLLEIKAEALIKLRNYEEAIQVCEQSLEHAEKNAVITTADGRFKESGDFESTGSSFVRLWRWRVISKSYFYLGRLEEACKLLEKHEKITPVVEKYGIRSLESSISFLVTVRELLRLKAAGNEAFQAGKHLEAVELYTAALALNTESRPFIAVCFCNRAAAYQALGQITDAIADCSLAIALDSSYKKAISRRATLHEMIRDFSHAAADLHKLISLLEMSSEYKYNASRALDRSANNISDLNLAHLRLSTVEEEARKGPSLEMYMILGIDKSSSVSDVKKAYRKAALRHHPDKAGQFLARSENGDDRIWREVAEEVHADADRLFKMIGEAYAVLSDPSKRLQYDAEEELRTALKKGYGGSSSPRTTASSYSSSQSDRSVNQRHWRTYGSSNRKQSESSWSNR